MSPEVGAPDATSAVAPAAGERLWLWLREETKEGEFRAALAPEQVRWLIDQGVRVTVEESPHRAIDFSEYRAAGAEPAPAGSWQQAPREVWVLGLKELTEDGSPLVHRHVYFGHAFKGQRQAPALLARFGAGGGQLWDLEYLSDAATGRRLAAFGHWAGWAGATLAMLEADGLLTAPLTPASQQEWRARLGQRTSDLRERPTPLRSVVFGARGRSGQGAVQALTEAGVQVSAWDLAETRELDRSELLRHDIAVNCVVATEPGEPFVSAADLSAPGRRLRVLADVTCDVDSDLSRVPVNDRLTTWSSPVRVLPGDPGPDLSVIALDNLPSLLPAEATRAYSADLAPHLLQLGNRAAGSPWASAVDAFEQHLGRAGGDAGSAPKDGAGHGDSRTCDVVTGHDDSGDNDSGDDDTKHEGEASR